MACRQRADGVRRMSEFVRAVREGLRSAVVSASADKMRAEGVAEVAIDTFEAQLERLRGGEQGVLAESVIEPVTALPDADDLPGDEEGARAALAQTVVIKLNGGLGTSMGMSGPKSLLEVKDGLTFLDITVRQILDLRTRMEVALPLVLMNSFATRDASLAALEPYGDLPLSKVELDFLQSKVPSSTPRRSSRCRGLTIRTSSGLRPATATCTRRC